MTAPTHHENELTRRLHTLTEPIDAPPLTEAAVRGGRAVVRRRRVLGTAAALSVLATAGALGSVSGLLGSSEGQLAGPAGSPGASVAPTGGTHHSKNAGSKDDKAHRTGVETWCNHVGPQRAREEDRRYGATRDGFADLVIEHLDPHQLHLHKSEGGETRTGRNCSPYALGTDLGYTSPGADGLGAVGVEVFAADWAAQEGVSGSSWRGWKRAGSTPAGVAHAYTREDSIGLHVTVIRDDGTMVQVSADPLWGNNSQTPVAHMDITANQLLETAADPGFQLP